MAKARLPEVQCLSGNGGPLATASDRQVDLEPRQADGLGALLTGDSITVVPDRRFVSFMRSYPNLIPLSEAEIRRIVSTVEPYRFDRVYGGWWDRVVARDGKDAIKRSADRYLQWSQGTAGRRV